MLKSLQTIFIFLFRFEKFVLFSYFVCSFRLLYLVSSLLLLCFTFLGSFCDRLSKASCFSLNAILSPKSENELVFMTKRKYQTRKLCEQTTTKCTMANVLRKSERAGAMERRCRLAN